MRSRKVMGIALVGLLMAGVSYGVTIPGSNITIYDRIGALGQGQGGEDQEHEGRVVSAFEPLVLMGREAGGGEGAKALPVLHF